MDVAKLFLFFYGDNRELLTPPVADGGVVYPLSRRASIKDIIEALGVPHTEIGRIELDGHELTFQYLPQAGERIHVFAHVAPRSSATVLRTNPVPDLRFMVDVNVQKVARNLRMIGIDASLVPGGTLQDVASAATLEQRILVTRNRELLKLSRVVHGQLLRSENHLEQLGEVIDRYALKRYIKPFTRCLSCNGVLTRCAKEDILDRLEPRTRKYYTSFKTCLTCNKIYWQGSHHREMRKILSRF